MEFTETMAKVWRALMASAATGIFPSNLTCTETKLSEIDLITKN